jgi:N-acetylmuramoyl-L-alanine amidase
MAAVVAFFVSLNTSCNASNHATGAEVYALPVVVIDPGHGGKDPGAVGPTRLLEKDVVMDVARRLKTFLEKRNIAQPMLTRSGDYYVTLGKRLQLAEEAGADMFISLHADAAVDRQAIGTSVFFLSLKEATDKVARLLAKKANTDAIIAGEYDPEHQDVVLGIVLQMKQTMVINESSRLASITLEVLTERIGTVARGVHRAGFAVLKSVYHPSILVELAFISNRKEEKLLCQSTFKQKLAEALGTGIETYLESLPSVQANMQITSTTVAPPPEKQTAATVYTVKKGDTLWDIGRKFHVEIADLIKSNSLKNSAMLRIGQKLSIPSF